MNLLSLDETGLPARVQVKLAWQGGEVGNGRRAQNVAGPRRRANTGLGALVKRISGSSSFLGSPPPLASITFKEAIKLPYYTMLLHNKIRILELLLNSGCYNNIKSN